MLTNELLQLKTATICKSINYNFQHRERIFSATPAKKTVKKVRQKIKLSQHIFKSAN